MIKRLYNRLLYRNTDKGDIPRTDAIKERSEELWKILSEKLKKEQENDVHGLSQKEVVTVLDEMLYNNRITDGSFLYAWDDHDAQGLENGSHKFSLIAQSRAYNDHINKNEKLLYEDDALNNIIANISRDKSTHIELGPETGEKFIQYSHQWDPYHYHLKHKKYIGVDVSGVYVDMANKNVEKIGMKAGSALTLDLNRVNSTLVYKQSMLVADILCIKLGKEKDIIIYSDMGYDVNKHTLVRQEWGVLKSFSSPNAYCKGIIGIGYDGKINMIKPYLLLHI